MISDVLMSNDDVIFMQGLEESFPQELDKTKMITVVQFPLHM